MLVAIHQPCFLPWLGYLDRMMRSDQFVILDHVQFERRNYQNRALILNEGEARWLTVPVVQVSQKETLLEKRVDNPESTEGDRWWGPKAYQTLRYAYRKAPHFELYAPKLKEILHARWERHLDRMKRSVDRMSGLIGDVLDFARGRLGGGIPIDRRSDESLPSQLRQVIAEVQSGCPGQVIQASVKLEAPVNCDPERVAQLFSNLLANAVAHGDPAQPIHVKARSNSKGMTLSVSNGGMPIPAETRARLFEPFWRGRSEHGKPSMALGLGLGLYIAAEIAKAHGGTLQVSSDPGKTTFLFNLPSVATHTQD